ncbi:unnamed protein product [Urochloa humidicola]
MLLWQVFGIQAAQLCLFGIQEHTISRGMHFSIQDLYHELRTLERSEQEYSSKLKAKKQHRNRTLKEAADEEAIIMKEVDKVFETLSHHAKDMDKLRSEIKRVTKIYAVSCIGISAYAFFWRWSHGEFTQPAAQGTSH